ncbi:MAG: phosphatidylglycerophosphatase A [Pseudomonadota bacterium]
MSAPSGGGVGIANMISGGLGLHRLGAFAGVAAAALAIPVAWALHWIGGFPLVALAVVIGAAKVLWAAPRAQTPMVADRMVGQLTALSALSGGLWFAGVAPHIFPYPGWIGAFVMFNLFLHLPPIRRLSALGPLWDDLAAGAAAAGVALVSAAISHGWLA